MLIVSKFRDYYDTASTYGVDKTIVYNRKKEDLEYTYKRDDKSLQPDRWSNRYWDRGWRKYKTYDFIDSVVIGFCGKIYPLYVLQEGSQRESVYDKDEVLKKIDAGDILKDSSWGGHSDCTNRRYIERFFDTSQFNYLLPLFVDHQVPIFVLQEAHRGHTLTLSPTLKDFKFGKIMAAPQCFQEIQNYISGVLGTEGRDMLEISNEMQAAKKGYDKWSFRTMPGDSKKPRGKKK